MATLTSAVANASASPAQTPAERASSATASASASMSGEFGDLAAQFNQRRYRPLGVADLFDESFDLYRSNFVLFLGASALILLPLNLIIYLFVLPGLNAATQHLARTQLDPSDLWIYLGQTLSAALTLFIVHGLFFILLSGASIGIASNRYLGRPARLGAAYKAGLRRALPLLLCLMIATLAVAVATPFCLLPGLYVGCRFALLPQVVILEPALKPFAAIRRAWNITSTHFWRVVGILVLLTVLSVVVELSLQGPIALAVGTLPLDSVPLLGEIARHQDIANDITDVVAGLLTTPFTFVAMTALYYDIRIRDEGYDMAILADLLGFSGSATQPAATALPQAPAPTTSVAPTLPQGGRSMLGPGAGR